MNHTRRQLCLGSAYGVVAMLAGTALNAIGVTPKDNNTLAAARIIPIEARKFRYTPNHIVIKAGEAVILELTAIDFTHGFTLPDLHTRADLIPGKAVQVRLKIDQPGTYDFLCDNFCGNGHEEMNGKLIVEA